MKDFPIIDFHSHVLPHVDHGCSNTKEALSQLSLMAQSNTDIAVATSHFYPHEYDIKSYIQLVDAAVSRLQAKNPASAPKLAIGAEVLLYPNMHLMECFEKLYIRGTKVILLELPCFHLADNYFDTAEQIIKGGSTVVLAHIDRYLKEYSYEIDTLLSMGALAQINAYSLQVMGIKKKLLNYLETSEKICAIGSDLHGVDEKKYKKFAKAEKILGEHYASIMLRAQSLLADAEYVI